MTNVSRHVARALGAWLLLHGVAAHAQPLADASPPGKPVGATPAAWRAPSAEEGGRQAEVGAFSTVGLRPVETRPAGRSPVARDAEADAAARRGRVRRVLVASGAGFVVGAIVGGRLVGGDCGALTSCDSQGRTGAVFWGGVGAIAGGVIALFLGP